MRITTFTDKFEVPNMNGDQPIEIELDIDVKWSYDSSYGADADGNRGVGVWTIEGVFYEYPETLDLTAEQAIFLDKQVKSKAEKLEVPDRSELW